MELIQSNLLKKVTSIRHGFFGPGTTGSSLDNFSFNQGEYREVQRARQTACSQIGINSQDLTHVYQVHGTRIWKVTFSLFKESRRNGKGQLGEGDALITDCSHIPLAILVADCLPIFIAHRTGQCIGIVHAGWRGTLKGIASAAVHRMVEEFTVDPEELLVWIGPGICGETFEIGEEVWSPFYRKWGHIGEAFLPQTRTLDLKRINAYQLEKMGVKSHWIEISSESTYKDHRFFSYRRDGAGVGHNMAVIQKG